MLPSIFQSSTIPVLEQVVNFAQARHSILAGNIANMDTPGYKVRDLSVENFQDRLKEAIQTRDQQALNSPGTRKLSEGDPLREVKDSMKSILYHDQSNVGIEEQVLEVSNNQFMHNMAISIMTSQFQLLETAISERV